MPSSRAHQKLIDVSSLFLFTTTPCWITLDVQYFLVYMGPSSLASQCTPVTPEGKEKVMDKLEHLGYEVDLDMDVSKLAEHKEDAVHHHTHRALEGDHHHTHHVGQDHDTLDAKKHHHDEHGAEAEHSH